MRSRPVTAVARRQVEHHVVEDRQHVLRGHQELAALFGQRETGGAAVQQLVPDGGLEPLQLARRGRLGHAQHIGRRGQSPELRGLGEKPHVRQRKVLHFNFGGIRSPVSFTSLETPRSGWKGSTGAAEKVNLQLD
jgi:hypothetical protein